MRALTCFAVLVAVALAGACSDGPRTFPEGPVGPGPNQAGPPATPDAGPDAGGQDAGVPDLTGTSQAAIEAFVQSGDYTRWTQESAQRASTTHGGAVERVFVNPALLPSLKAGALTHPVGSAAVLALFEADGTTLQGHGVIALRGDAGTKEPVFFLDDGLTVTYQVGASATCVSCHFATTDHLQSPGSRFP